MKVKYLWVSLVMVVLAGCSKPVVEPVMVFAAAGTAPAMKAIAAQYEKETGRAVVFNFANAGALAKQLSAGAEADLFFSANEKWMDFVADKELVQTETRTVLLSNRMVVIEPIASAPDEREFELSARMQAYGRIAIGDPVTPLGIYVKQAFTKLGLWAGVEAKACRGDTVQKVLNYVALNEADAGVVFQSVALCAADRVRIAGVIPAELHKPIRFPVAACVGATDDASLFLDYLKSDAATVIFEKFGWIRFAEKGPVHV